MATILESTELWIEIFTAGSPICQSKRLKFHLCLHSLVKNMFITHLKNGLWAQNRFRVQHPAPTVDSGLWQAQNVTYPDDNIHLPSNQSRVSERTIY